MSKTSAQVLNDARTIELFAGYSHVPERDPIVKPFSDPGRGWGTSLSVNLRKHLALIADFDMYSQTIRGHETLNGLGSSYISGHDDKVYYVSVGPQFVAPLSRVAIFGLAGLEYQTSRFSAYSIVGPGAVYGRDGPDSVPRVIGTRIQTIQVPAGSGHAWGLGVGGGADISVTKRLAVRAVQINYSLGGFGQSAGHALRLKSGLVFKF